MKNAKQEAWEDKRKYLFSFLLVLSVVTCGGSRMVLKAGEARRGRQTSNARGHKRGNTVCWVCNQNNNSVSAVQMRPGCSVPAWYWLFECLCVFANLDQSGTEGTASPSTVHCVPTAMSTYYVHFNHPGTGSFFPLFVLHLYFCVFVYLSVVQICGSVCDVHILPFTPAIVPWTSVAAQIAQ